MRRAVAALIALQRVFENREQQFLDWVQSASVMPIEPLRRCEYIRHDEIIHDYHPCADERAPTLPTHPIVSVSPSRQSKRLASVPNQFLAPLAQTGAQPLESIANTRKPSQRKTAQSILLTATLQTWRSICAVQARATRGRTETRSPHLPKLQTSNAARAPHSFWADGAVRAMPLRKILRPRS